MARHIAWACSQEGFLDAAAFKKVTTSGLHLAGRLGVASLRRLFAAGRARAQAAMGPSVAKISVSGTSPGSLDLICPAWQRAGDTAWSWTLQLVVAGSEAGLVGPSPDLAERTEPMWHAVEAPT